MPEDPVADIAARVGEPRIADLCAAFYRRVATDDLLRPLYPEEDLTAAEQRLRDFLVQRFGGSDRYARERGHPRLRMRHAPFAIDRRARDRWMMRMGEALDEVALPAAERARIEGFLGDVATFLINRPG